MSQMLQPNTAPSVDEPIVPKHCSQAGPVIVWGIVASVLLIGAGLGRVAQSRYYEEEYGGTVECPFPLHEIPKILDGWHMVEGSETVLDPLTTRITGSTDHIVGNYVDEQTGVILSVMVLYGPAEPVLPHIPEICYPSSGFKAVGPSLDRTITADNSQSVVFRSGVYAKSGGRSVIQESAYYSFRHDGTWIPWVSTKDSPRKNPGIFKMQIQRRMAIGEARFQDEPIEEFIKKMMPALERMIDDAAKTTRKGAATA